MKLLDQAIPVPSKRAYPTNSWMPPAGVRIISSDDHNMEVSHLFEERLPDKFKHKAPELYVEGNEIVCEAEGRSLIPKGVDIDAQIGLPGYFDLDAKVKHMDAENISSALIFHGMFQALNTLQDRELYWACVDVYNEWLVEYLKPHADRMTGVAILPAFEKPEAAHDYMQKLKDLGYRAVQMPHSPKGIRWNSKELFPVWKAVEESGMPLSFHAGAYPHYFGNGSLGANIAMNLCPYRGLFGALVFSGALDQHPELKVVFHEGGATWAAQAMTDMDFIVATYGHMTRPKLSAKPSGIWRRQCHASFMVDPCALKLVDFIGEDNLIWCADYPHAEGTWGFTGDLLKEAYETLGPVAGAKFLGGNAERLWKL